MAKKKEIYQRENVKDQELIGHVDDQIRKAAKALAESMKEKEYLGSICLHFYAGTNLVTAESRIAMVTQRVDLDLSQEAATLMMPEVRDRIFEALGGKRMELKPQTVEETRDTGGTIIKTSLDS